MGGGGGVMGGGGNCAYNNGLMLQATCWVSGTDWLNLCQLTKQ